MYILIFFCNVSIIYYKSLKKKSLIICRILEEVKRNFNDLEIFLFIIF